MVILGIGGVLRSASAALLINGEIVAAIEEAKLSRSHHAGDLPAASIAACLSMGGITAEQVDCVAITRPLASGGSKLHLQLRTQFPHSRIVVVEHHAAHAAAAYFASPFEEATVLTLDRSGDFRCGARWIAKGNSLSVDHEMYLPDSLGDIYGRVTELLGFRQGADEHKVQWLSASGDDTYTDFFLELLSPQESGVRINRTWIAADKLGRGGFSSEFFHRAGLKEDEPLSPKLQASIASGLQRAVERVVLQIARTGGNLCLGGGLAFNAFLVAALERSGAYSGVFVQPNAGNAGNALGAVYYVWNMLLQNESRPGIGNFCLGPGYGPEDIKQVLENCKLRFRYLLTTDELVDTAVAELSDQKIVAWMHGRMEFGPRALGNRSILASPLDPYSTENLNAFIKHREPFRKFAASVPEELAGEYFEVGPNARFLATAGKVRPAYRDRFQGAILGDDWIRVHTVRHEDNALYWQLLHAAGRKTGLPALFNTSFNLFADPLVCTPRDAVRSFYSSGIDSMFVGNFLLKK